MSKLIIPEEIKAALATVEDETAEKVMRQLCGIKFDFWAIEIGTETSQLLQDAKERAKAYAETPADQRDPDGFKTILTDAAMIAERMEMQHELDAIFEEVNGIMERLSEDDGDKPKADVPEFVLSNGHITDISRAMKSNKNDGDKGVMPA